MHKIYTLGVPLKDGCNVKGADLGISLFEKDITFNEILSIQNIDENIIPNMKNIQTITNVVNTLAHSVYQALKKGNKVITIGGDHALAIGTIAGSSTYQKIGILWVDSHGDINNETTTLTGNVHGFPLASSIGLGPEVLNHCYHSSTKVNKEDIVIFGCSDLDEAEEKIIAEQHLKVYHYNQIEQDFQDKVKEAVFYLKSKVNSIHLSLDLDVIHPHIMQAVNTKTRADIGLTWEQVYYIIDTVFENIPVQSVDIVEYNPLEDIDGTCYNKVIELYQYIVSKIQFQK